MRGKLPKQKRMKSFVDRANDLIARGKLPEAVNIVGAGLKYYSDNIIGAISPYAAHDAGLLVAALRYLADQIEERNSGAKELAEYVGIHVQKPEFNETTKFKKPNME